MRIASLAFILFVARMAGTSEVEERAQALEEVRSLLRAEREQHRALLPDVQNALSQAPFRGIAEGERRGERSQN